MNKAHALILFVLSIGLFYTFTSPQYADVKTLSSGAEEYRSVIDNVSRIAETRDALLTRYESIPLVERERLGRVLPGNVDAVGLSRDLDTIASKYGISIDSVQVETGESQDSSGIVLPDFALPYEKATVTFSFISNYPNFIKFLADLEKSLRIMDVKEASFTVGENSLYEHKLTVETYWLK